jgi:hypothetical protein
MTLASIRSLFTRTDHLSGSGVDTVGQYPSLDIIRRELEFEVASQERRGASLDTKAGLILGFAGVIAGFAKDLPRWWLPPALLLAVAAGGTAVRALFPRIAASVRPQQLRNRHLTKAEHETALILLDTRIVLYEQDEERLKLKLKWMKVAVVLLFCAVALVGAGYIQKSMGAAHGDTTKSPGRTASPSPTLTR